MGEGVATREQAKAAAEKNQLPREMFLMAPWGGQVFVHALTEDETEAFARETTRRLKAQKRDKSVMVRSSSRILIATVHAADGSLFFTKDDESWLTAQMPNIPKQLVKLAFKMAGFSDEEADDLEGN